MENKPKSKRLTVNLSGDAAEALAELAELQGITQNEALRKAIATERLFFKARRDGCAVLLQNADKEIREILFR